MVDLNKNDRRYKKAVEMMKTLPKGRRKKTTSEASASANLDLDPDAWPKFEALVKSAAKMGPKPHGPKQRVTGRKAAKR
jgi:hypothetical protein